MNIDRLLPLLINVGRAVWSTIADRDENEDRAKAIARAAMDAALAEARFQAELAGIVIAHDALDAAMQRALDAFNPPANPTIGIRGLNVEIMPADWKPGNETDRLEVELVAPIDEKFDGSGDK